MLWHLTLVDLDLSAHMKRDHLITQKSATRFQFWL